MRHLDDWHQHFVQVQSEAKVKGDAEIMAEENDHTGQTIAVESWFERLFSGRGNKSALKVKTPVTGATDETSEPKTTLH